MSDTKSIVTLTADIYDVLDASKDHTPNPDLAADYAMRIGGEFASSTLKRDKPREHGRLWASDLGKKCRRAQWYQFNEPQHAEKLTGNTKFKFLYGNILEEAVLYMAEEAGHEVSHQQFTVEHKVDDWTIRGRIDALIDGVLVDVKSTSSFGFKRYKTGIDASNDSFGYLEQLGFYSAFGDYGQIPTDQGFVWIDKQNGHIKYTSAAVKSGAQLEGIARDISDAVEQVAESSVPKAFAPAPYGKSGNESLPTACSYCAFKRHCWRDSNSGRGLRTFMYNQGPVHFTTINREPRASVPEITNEG
jgi:hypothetical protein